MNICINYYSKTNSSSYYKIAKSNSLASSFMEVYLYLLESKIHIYSIAVYCDVVDLLTGFDARHLIISYYFAQCTVMCFHVALPISFGYPDNGGVHNWLTLFSVTKSHPMR